MGISFAFSSSSIVMHSIYLAYLSIGMLPRLDGETDDAIRAKILGACALRI